MNQKKTGELLRKLRKERGLTQEQVAEKFNTTNRSVSRWENGSTMPDISILVELADYADAEKDKLLTFMRGVSLTGVVSLFIALILLAVYFQPQARSLAAYSIPAYVACNGFGDMYEYELIDEENLSVTYVHLSYPETSTETAYKNYLKRDLSLYNITDSFNQFTIYAHSFDGGEIWTEVSDTVE